MREDTRRKLDEAMSGDSKAARRAVLGALLLAVVFGAVVLAWNTRTHRQWQTGEVRHATWRIDPDSGRWYPVIEVVLDSGRLVRVGTLQGTLPRIGDHIEFRETVDWFGRHGYHWDGLATKQGAQTDAR